MNQEQIIEKKWWQFKYMGKKDYGRIAIAGFIIAGIKSSINTEIHPLIDLLCNIIMGLALIASIYWIIEFFKNRKNEMGNKNFMTKEKISTIMLTIYTIINATFIIKFLSFISEYESAVWFYLGQIHQGGIMFIGIIASMFLNAWLIIFYNTKRDYNKK